MKQIFDWLREQIDKFSFFYASKDSARRKYIDCADLENIINEAEAKWESDCCEWRLCDEEENVYDTSCRNPHILIEGTPKENNYEYCPYCGKKIKVVE